MDPETRDLSVKSGHGRKRRESDADEDQKSYREIMGSALLLQVDQICTKERDFAFPRLCRLIQCKVIRGHRLSTSADVVEIPTPDVVAFQTKQGLFLLHKDDRKGRIIVQNSGKAKRRLNRKNQCDRELWGDMDDETDEGGIGILHSFRHKKDPGTVVKCTARWMVNQKVIFSEEYNPTVVSVEKVRMRLEAIGDCLKDDVVEVRIDTKTETTEYLTRRIDTKTETTEDLMRTKTLDKESTESSENVQDSTEKIIEGQEGESVQEHND